MEQGRRDEREHVASALGRRRRIGATWRSNWSLGDELAWTQRVAASAANSSKARCVSLADAPGQWPRCHFAARVGLAYVLAHEPGGGRGGEAPRNLDAELDVTRARCRAPHGRWCSIQGWAAFGAGRDQAPRPDVELVYAADDAFFPYGALSEAALVERVETVMARLIGETEPDIVRHRLQHRLHPGFAAAESRLSAPAVCRHRAGDQAGRGGVAVGIDQRLGDARHRGARLHP